MFVDPNPDPVTGQRGSIYIADGYGNHRVVVFSRQRTYLRAVGRRRRDGERPGHRHPGLFGPGDGGHPHCVVTAGRVVYACDRGEDRIQVFTRRWTCSG